MNYTEIPRYPARLSQENFYPTAYYYMYLSRILDQRVTELFKKGHVKGTVVVSIGAEASTVGMSIPFRPGRDCAAIAHRDLGAHLVLGMPVRGVLCQYMANSESPTFAREGNVHYGVPSMRRIPFMSHLAAGLAPAVGATWAARRNGEDVFGLAVIGDGGSSTGDFHESINLASVRKVPVLFMIENNQFAFSTRTKYQFNCARLSDRAAGYGIEGVTVDGTDVWQVYQAVLTALDTMHKNPIPYLIESNCLRLMGHAVYDKADYVTANERTAMLEREPLAKARAALRDISGYSEQAIESLEKTIEAEIEENLREALAVKRPAASDFSSCAFAPAPTTAIAPFKELKVKNGAAVNKALDYILGKYPEAVLMGQDIGAYGSVFKTCKGLHEKYGSERVIDMPVCESATVGFCIGASQTGSRPIFEFQFSDFATDCVTQLGLNAGSWFYRSGASAPILMRMPCGGGITMGAHHSGEYEGLWARFPGVKVVYPVTAQETFEALVVGFLDPNPVCVLEHKLLYWNRDGDIDFDGNIENVFRPRRYRDGSDLTVVAFGAMIDVACAALDASGYNADVWNPFILKPLQLEPIIESVRKTGRLLVVQESIEIAGLGDHIISKVVQSACAALKHAPILIGSPDVPMPFARELEVQYLPNLEKVTSAIFDIMEKRR